MALVAVGGSVVLTMALAPIGQADQVTRQQSEISNSGSGTANSGGNTAIGNESDNLTDATQSASGDVASNSATGGNSSDGSGTVTTGAASATGNVADNAVVQAVAGGVGAGVSVVTQTIDVLNSGDATADSGGNVGIGNRSINTAISDQTADGGLVGANSSTGGNSSNGTGSVVTGAATASGNVAVKRSTQSAGPDASFLSVILQDILTANSGIATAASGDNTGIGNESDSFVLAIQSGSGDVASNAAPAGSTSDGLGFLSTGIADAVGSSASNEQTQSATG